VTLVKHELCTSSHGTLHLCQLISKCNQPFKNYRADKLYSLQCLTLNYDLDLKLTLVKHTHYTLTHHTWQLCRAIWKFHQRLKKYKVETKAWQTDGQMEGRTNLVQCLASIITGGLMLSVELKRLNLGLHVHWPYSWANPGARFNNHDHHHKCILYVFCFLLWHRIVIRKW